MKWRGAREPYWPVLLAILGAALVCTACGSTTKTIIIKTVTAASQPSSTANPKLRLLSAYLGVPAPPLAAELASGQNLTTVILEHGGTLAGWRQFQALVRRSSSSQPSTSNGSAAPRYAPGDQNLSDPNAAPCESRSFTQADVGPHAFCATADEVIQIFLGNTPNRAGGNPAVLTAELQGGASVAAQEGTAEVRFRCTYTGQVLNPRGPGATADVVRCISKTDPRDWFEFELT